MRVMVFDGAEHLTQFQGCHECKTGNLRGGGNECYECLRHYRNDARLKTMADRFVKFQTGLDVRDDDLGDDE